MVKKKILCIVQARSRSSRFPLKVLKNIKKFKILEILLKRIKKSKKIDQIIVATTKDKIDNEIVKVAHKLGIFSFRGANENVLQRYYYAAKKYKAETIVRLTADCPLSDPQLVDDIINSHLKSKADYTSNTLIPTFPDGLDVEVFKFSKLKTAYQKSKSNFEKEHVTPFLKSDKKIFKNSFENNKDNSDSRWTIDEEEDLVFLKKILSKVKFDIFIGWKELLKIEKKNKYLKKINSVHKRNEGSKTGINLKRWNYAKTKIVAGNSLLSKRPIVFAPDIWPTYYSKAKGINIWDLDNNKFQDFSLMGIGTNTMGYANSKIDKKVIESLKKSNMSTLNCFEEVQLAEKLLELHKWAGKVKFARSGAEANTIALRIARCTSKKSNVAICGYHGWHDWYLSSNFKSKKKLDNHLLKGLNVLGVNDNLKDTTFPFDYNSTKQLINLIKTKKIGIIFMEVSRNIVPKNNFLKKVQKIAKENNIVLIFDECTSGFREINGGLHLKYGVNPDICVFGKSLGNGYPITAVIGKDHIMDKSLGSFMSSTFWSDRSGPVAALETLNQMQKKKSWEYISKIGKKIKSRWIIIAKKHNLKIKVYGLDSMPSFEIISDKFQEYKTYITQEMLKKRILANNSIYVSIKHNEKNLNKYFNILDKIFKKIKYFEKNNIEISSFLNTRTSQTNFKRLN